jgi:DNA-binding transcriptional LysR family regulator
MHLPCSRYSLPSSHNVAQNGAAADVALSLRALAGETFTAYGPPPIGLPANAIALCHAVGFTPRTAQAGARISSALSFVAAGLGISIVPASVQRMNIDGVVFRRLKGAATGFAHPGQVATAYPAPMDLPDDPRRRTLSATFCPEYMQQGGVNRAACPAVSSFFGGIECGNTSEMSRSHSLLQVLA